MFTIIVDKGNPYAEILKKKNKYLMLDPIVAPRTRAK